LAPRLLRYGVLKLCARTGGELLKPLRLCLLLLTAALFSVSAWAQDPKPIPQNGTDATVITLTNPNPTVTATAQANSAANPCPFQSAFCVDDNFQNATGKTLTSITMSFASQISNGMTLVFNCPSSQEMLSAVFFDNCSQSAGPKGTENITFSADMKNGFDGVLPARCVSPEAAAVVNSACTGDEQLSGGLFAIDMYGTDVVMGTTITTTAITTPEPGAGLMVLFSALAFALFKLVRRP
jgi:hypothetical protein